MAPPAPPSTVPSPVVSVLPGVPEGASPASAPEFAVLEAEASTCRSEPSAEVGAPGLATPGFPELATGLGTPWMGARKPGTAGAVLPI